MYTCGARGVERDCTIQLCRYGHLACILQVSAFVQPSYARAGPLPSKMVVRRDAPKSRTRFSPYLRGAIFALSFAGWTFREIAEEIAKPDGQTPCHQSVADVVKQAKGHGGFEWDGEPGTTSKSRPRTTSTALDKAIVKVVFKHRGRAVVTVNYIKKVLKAARKVSNKTLQRRLCEAGLAWLRRRRKSLVPAAHKTARLEWATWVLARTAVTLAQWAYTDGTTFFLARAQNEFEDKRRAALGPFVWRQANGDDGLYEECIGPSAYWKSQGYSVRVWGLLVAGMLFVTVLPDGEVMNKDWYKWVIEKRFPKWLRQALGRRNAKKARLLQDHERCLWAVSSLDAMKAVGITLLDNFPKCSQDLNPIETAWRELRARLAVTEPTSLEDRSDFVQRLRSAVAWVNRNRKAYLRTLCSSQKAWAADVQDAEGGRTQH